MIREIKIFNATQNKKINKTKNNYNVIIIHAIYSNGYTKIYISYDPLADKTKI